MGCWLRKPRQNHPPAAALLHPAAWDGFITAVLRWAVQRFDEARAQLERAIQLVEGYEVDRAAPSAEGSDGAA